MAGADMEAGLFSLTQPNPTHGWTPSTGRVFSGQRKHPIDPTHIHVWAGVLLLICEKVNSNSCE